MQRLGAVDGEAFAEHRIEQAVGDSDDLGCLDDVPLEELLICVHGAVVLAVRTDSTFQPPVR